MTMLEEVKNCCGTTCDKSKILKTIRERAVCTFVVIEVVLLPDFMIKKVHGPFIQKGAISRARNVVKKYCIDYLKIDRVYDLDFKAFVPGAKDYRDGACYEFKNEDGQTFMQVVIEECG